jgi:hypothetical protein
MKAHRVMGRGMRAAVWAVACVLWILAVPRTSRAFEIEDADGTGGCGESWQIVAPWPTPHSLVAVTWTGTTLVAVGLAGTILTSPDGVVWTARASGTMADLTGFTWAGDQIVAVGDGGTILRSRDGIMWTPRDSGTNCLFTAAVWTGTRIVAIGESGEVATSSDGVTWTQQQSGTPNQLDGEALAGPQVVAAGEGGTILISPCESPCSAPNITAQPESRSVVTGQMVTHSPAATGTPSLSYQWLQGLSGNTWSLGDSDASTITTPALTTPPSDWVRVTDGCGHADLAAATVTIGSRVRRRLRGLEPTGLVLPYENLAELVEARCYGVDPWDDVTKEIHGGIDLIPRHTDLGPGQTRKVGLVAPASGTIYDVRELAKTGKADAFMVTVKVNDYWFVGMVLEPQNLDPSIADEQRRSIAVQTGDVVGRGDRIGELVVTNVHYPHVHFMIYYKDPNQTYEELLANYILLPRNQGDNLPPTSGPGSPWAPENLEIPSMLYCPYVYSEWSSKTRMDQILKQSHDSTVCRCICAYGSKNADCGVCSQ